MTTMITKNRMNYLTKSAKQTIALGKKIATTLRGGEVFGLSGDLGAGKTTLVKGIALGLGVKKPITSPTFVLMKVYRVTNRPIKKLVHIDCYRLKGSGELTAIGAPEYFGQKDTVVLIEWPEKIKNILPKKILNVKLKLGKKNNQRKINFNV